MSIEDQTHKQKMQDQKETVDGRIKSAKDKKGLILILTGEGKGKSSSAFGMVARALGHKMRCGVVQFIKGKMSTGEERFFSRFPEEVEYHATGDGYTWDTQNKQADIRTAERGWAIVKTMLSNPEVDLIVLDELNIVLNMEYLNLDQIMNDLQARPERQHVIITGRGAPEKLIEQADTVSEVKLIKHAFEAGVQAQKGIEL
ncbi:MAG: cob(I)yrinic acid a,c-diamide adenosyltransferase [Gammaproteobacteria bacterium]